MPTTARSNYTSSRALTLVQNTLLGARPPQCHSRYHASDARVLQSLPPLTNSGDFVFNEMLTQAILFGHRALPDEVFPVGLVDQFPLEQ